MLWYGTSKQRLAAFILINWLVCEVAVAEIFIEQAFPPCVQRGRSNRVTFVGVELQEAEALWSTTEAVRAKLISAADDRATFDVETSPDAHVGLYGFRVATRSGLSNLHLFAIDDMPLVDEEETVRTDASNNRPSAAQVVDLPAVVVGTSPESDLDHFAIDVAAGQPVSFEVVGSRLGKAFDPVITILDARGRTVRSWDNDPGLFFDFRFSHTFESDGRYLIRLHDSRYHGSPHWTYMLRMGRFPASRVALPSTILRDATQQVAFPGFSGEKREVSFADRGPVERHGRARPKLEPVERFYFGLRGENDDAPVWVPLRVSTWPSVVESEPNDTADAAIAAAVPANLHGSFQAPGEEDWFAFALKKGMKLEFRSETRTLGSPADIELALYDSAGKRLKSSDDSGFDDARFSFSVPADGTYNLQVTELVRKAGTPYTYRVEVAKRQPDIRLQSSVGRLTIPRNTWQPLPLTVERTDFGGEVQLELRGAPAGMTLRSSAIPEGAKELTAAIVVDQSVPFGLHTVQVVGSATHEETAISSVAATSPLVDREPTGRGPHGEAFELREDQRRLPPTVTDRIAVLVIPESSWDFEVVEDEVVVPRYVRADFRIRTTRNDGYGESVSFVARGGLLEYMRLRKPSITSEIPIATPENPEVTAVLKSGVNTRLERHRVTVTGSARDGDRTVHLTRTFELETKPAYRPSLELQNVELKPGDRTTVKIAANRLPPFADAVKLTFTAPEGVEVPELVEIPTGEQFVEIELRVAADIKPGKHSVAITGDAVIGTFLERVKGDKLTVVVKN